VSLVRTAIEYLRVAQSHRTTILELRKSLALARESTPEGHAARLAALDGVGALLRIVSRLERAAYALDMSIGLDPSSIARCNCTMTPEDLRALRGVIARDFAHANASLARAASS
jgi:hypothetical protein